MFRKYFRSRYFQSLLITNSSFFNLIVALISPESLLCKIITRKYFAMYSQNRCLIVQRNYSAILLFKKIEIIL